MSDLEQIKEKEEVILRRSTLVPISVAIAAAGFMFMGYVSIESKFRALEIQIAELRVSIAKMQDTMDSTKGNRWTSQDQMIWALSMERNNPTMKVPDVNAIIGIRVQ